MTVDLRPKGTAETLSELARRLYTVEQQGSRPSGDGSGGLGDNPSVDTITIGGVVVGADASPATNLALSTGAHMDDIWIDADWDAPADGTAAGYDVELSRKVGTNFELVQNFHIGGGTSLRMAGLHPDQAYGVRVVAINSIGVRSTPLPTSGFAEITTTIDATIPEQAGGLQLTAGIRTIMATWTEVQDRDVARGTGIYQVQLATDSGFTSLFADKHTTATITSFSGVVSSTTYWGRVRAIDNSGNAGPWSSSVSVTTVKTGSGDIADSAVGTVHIANLAVTNAKIADLAVDNAKIADLSADKITAGTINADRIAANSLDVNKLTSSTLTSKTITIGAGGIIKVGNPPTTGLIINDQGLRLYSAGAVKMALDVLGTATFEGNISASTITSSTLTSATINAGTITGATIRTAATGQRLALEATSFDSLFLYTGHASESIPGRLSVGLVGPNFLVELRSPRSSLNDYSVMTLNSVAGGNGSECAWSLWSSSAFRASLELSATSNVDTPHVFATGIDELYLQFGGGTTNAEAKLRGSGDYSFLYLYGAGAIATLNCNIGLGAGFHVLDSNNSSFQPIQASAFNIAISHSQGKKNIRDESSALSRVEQLRVVRYNRLYENRNPEEPPHVARTYDSEEIGFLAEQLFEVIPEAVITDADNRPMGFNVSILLALLTKSVQELSQSLPGRS